MKEIQYNGGMIVFRVPDVWQEETYRGGGASYFAGTGQHGALYVTLTTARQPTAVDESSFAELANTGRESGDAAASRLPNGNWLRRFERGQEIKGVQQHTVFWMLSNLVPPNTARVALFNYGVPQSDAHDPTQAETVALLEQEIANARFTTLTPEQLAAAHRAARPWWKVW